MITGLQGCVLEGTLLLDNRITDYREYRLLQHKESRVVRAASPMRFLALPSPQHSSTPFAATAQLA